MKVNVVTQHVPCMFLYPDLTSKPILRSDLGLHFVHLGYILSNSDYKPIIWLYILFIRFYVVTHRYAPAQPHASLILSSVSDTSVMSQNIGPRPQSRDWPTSVPPFVYAGDSRRQGWRARIVAERWSAFGTVYPWMENENRHRAPLCRTGETRTQRVA